MNFRKRLRQKEEMNAEPEKRCEGFHLLFGLHIICFILSENMIFTF